MTSNDPIEESVRYWVKVYGPNVRGPFRSDGYAIDGVEAISTDGGALTIVTAHLPEREVLTQFGRQTFAERLPETIHYPAGQWTKYATNSTQGGTK